MTNSNLGSKRFLALAIGLCVSGGVLAQTTTGGLFGQAAAGQGDSVLIKSSTGDRKSVV